MKPEDRKHLLAMATRRAKPGSGSDLDALREAGAPYRIADLVPGLPGCRVAIVGGLAVARYMPARMTLDTDVLVAREDQDRMESLLVHSGATRLGDLAVGGSSWRLPGGRILDLLALDAPWVAEALDHVIRDEEGWPFISLPHLVAMKLESGRIQDLADISRMLGYAGENEVKSVRDVVARFRPQDAEDVESMIVLGKREHGDKA